MAFFFQNLNDVIRANAMFALSLQDNIVLQELNYHNSKNHIHLLASQIPCNRLDPDYVVLFGIQLRT
jgi:hypothetical protein